MTSETAAARLLEKYLGPGHRSGTETTWLMPANGRHALVYLQAYSNGAETITTFDTARAANRVARLLTVHGEVGLPELERELVSLTTPPLPASPNPKSYS